MALILVVEDDATNRDLVTRFLKREGHLVVQAEDGMAGVEAAQKQMPDLIVMDLGLPVLDGWEAARLIKACPETAQIPIIALTAHALAEDVQKAREAGCDAYETKPLIFRRLTNKIRALLEA